MNRQQWQRLSSQFETRVCDITQTDSKKVLPSILARVAPRTKRGTLVDLGCGIGTFIRTFGSRFDAIVGVDFSQGMLDRAERRCDGLRTIEWICGDVARISNRLVARADLTVSLNLITSTSAAKREALWASVARVTKPRGWAVVSIPSLESAEYVADTLAQRGLGRIAGRSRPGGLVPRGRDLQKFYRQNEVHEAMERNGFTSVRAQPIWYPWSEEGVLGESMRGQRLPWDWVVIGRRKSLAARR
ncbi:MAG TPA: class I SAM-dependent methyltransferase [Candidatus Kryptonia bacterium]|nr:class I SAM-dependent methyltransferase [Candidatus Kryptonia bacterium]